MEYNEFLQSKIVRQPAFGPPILADDIHSLLFDFQRDLTRWAIRKGRAAVFADTGLGKAQPIDEPVLTPNGWRPIGKLSVDDTIIGGDGEITTVQAIHPQGARSIVSIEFNDGARTEADLDHLWLVTTDLRESRKQPWQTLTTQEIASDLQQPDGRLKWRVPTVSMQLPESNTFIDPYVLGILIGDGCLTGSISSPIFTTIDNEIVQHVSERIRPPFAVRESTYSNRAPTYRISRQRGCGSTPSMFVSALRDLGLWGCYAKDKFIPFVYLFGSENQRLSLLRGLMDSDGWTGSATQFTTISEQLAIDVQSLVRSLGGTARMTSKIPTYYDGDGNRRNGHRAYNVTVKLSVGVNPFLITRKKERYNQIQRTPPVRKIKSISALGCKESVCIEVAAPHQTYITRDYVVTHNTFIQLEWSRIINTRTLIIAPLSVARQTVREAKKIDLDVHYTRSGDDLADKLNITNYEMIDHFDFSQFGAVVLDESSILKSLTGKTRRKLIKLCADIPYRLCCTATPAPNDHTEIGNHAEFLGICTRAEMLAMFFINANKEHTYHINGKVYRRKGSNKGGQEWRLKHHAEQAFYRWLASWAITLSKPSDLGYEDEGFILPPLNIHPHFVPVEYKPDDQLFFTSLGGVKERAKLRRYTLPQRLEHLTGLINGNSDEQWIVWTGLQAESAEATKLLDDAVEVKGSDSPEYKANSFEAFQDGKFKTLVTKAKIGGLGMNFQNAHKMAFLGLNDSWETYYQAIRREWRYMQPHPVDVHVIMSDLEGEIWHNIQRKDAQAARLRTGLIEAMRHYEEIELAMENGQTIDHDVKTAKGEKWTAMLGDACERLQEIDTDSIDLSIYSPPFADLYTYTDTERDLGNSRSWDEFFGHYAFIIREVLRVTKPGRLTCVHTSDIPAMAQKDGYIGVKDFPGAVIKAYAAEGWTFVGRALVQKNPQAQAIRVKNKALAFGQLRKDSAAMRPALVDHVLFFRKPGDNAVPILPVENGEIDNETWIAWAHGIWTGIQETKTLQYTRARGEDDEKHICPLQLETIERCIKLYSNPGETVLTPFGGIGSEGYQAVKFGRRAILIELKRDYFDVAVKNLKKIEAETTLPDLFTWAAQQEEDSEVTWHE